MVSVRNSSIESIFIVATIMSVIGFIICYRGVKTAIVGSLSIILGVGALYGVIYLVSNPYDYTADPYSDWYSENVIFHNYNSESENFGDRINGTAWKDQDGEIVFIFSDNKVYFAAKKKNNDWLHAEGTYTLGDYSSIYLKDIFINKASFSGEFTLRSCVLNSWIGKIRMSNFHRLHKNDLLQYGFDSDVIDLVTLVPKYGEKPSTAAQKDSLNRLQLVHEDSDERADFTKRFVDINVFIERKYPGWGPDNLSVPNFKDDIPSKLTELGYKESDVKRGTRVGEGGESYNYKVTTYKLTYPKSEKNAPWSKVVFDDGICGGYSIYFCDKEQKERFLKSCKKLGYTQHSRVNSNTLQIPAPNEDYSFDFMHEMGNCEITLYNDHVDISFGCV